MNKKLIISVADKMVLKLKVLAEEKESVLRIKTILDSMVEGVVVADTGMHFELFNKSAERILGLGLSQEDPSKWAKIYGVYLPDQKTPLPVNQFPLKKALKGEIVTDFLQYVKNNQRKKGLYLSTTAAPLRDLNGKITGAVAVLRDVSKEYLEKEDARLKLVETAKQLAVIAKEKEDVRLKLVETALKLKQSQDELVRTEKLAVIGKLAGIMGHEIRNPLGVIRNSIYFLNMKFKENIDEKVKRHMDILETEIVAADKIISDVLEFARTRPPSFTETEINSVVEGIISKVNIPKTVKVQTDLGENLPKINIDIAQIQQVFSNLISNAIEAMPKGGELRVTTSQTDFFISIAFKDTGVGIPKENIDKLFTPLFSTKTKGLGLGLAACQNIIVAHHGKIEFESKDRQGTTFTVALPIKISG
jgi:PAS domain S-box-containing protein